MSTLCLFLAVPRVGLQSVIVVFLGYTLSFIESLTVDENTIPLH